MITTIDTDKILGRESANKRESITPSDDNEVFITVDSALFRFRSVDTFSAAIEGRTSIPTALYMAVSQLNGDELTLLAKTLKKEEKTLIGVIERSLNSTNSFRLEINRIPIETFRDDHYWREIIVALGDSDAPDSYLQTAAVKYLQFLSSYQEVVRLLLALSPDAKHLQKQIDEQVESPYETALFDVLQYSDAGRMVNPYRRLPQGEAVTLHALPGHPINLLLAKYSFELVNENGWVLIDSRHSRHQLANDLNYVGRGRENDISLSSDYRNVSRKHVIIHPLDDTSVVLIDLSSHGTFVPPRQVDLHQAH